MTTITSVEELENLDSGTPVALQGRTWNFDGTLLRSGAFTLRPGDVAGDITNGRVTISDAIEVNQVWRAGTVRYYILATVSDEPDLPWTYVYTDPNATTVDPHSVMRADFHGVHRQLDSTPPFLTPERLQFLAALVEEKMDRERAAQADQRRIDRLTQSVDSVQQRWDTFRGAVQTDLQEFITDHLDDGSDERTALIAVMGRHDLEPPTPPEENIEVYVQVNGTSTVEFNTEEVGEQLGGAVAVDYGQSVSGQVEWTATVTVSDVTVPSGECGCNEIDRDDVEMEMDGDSDIPPYDDFSYEALHCDNCN